MAQTEDQNRDRADIRRLRILATARKLFIAGGFHATGVAQIAQQSGVCIGQIYRDFSGKEEIVLTAVRRELFGFVAAKSLHHNAISHDAAGAIIWLGDFLHMPDDRDTSRLLVEIAAEATRSAGVKTILMAFMDRRRSDILEQLEMIAPHCGHVQRGTVADLISLCSFGLQCQNALLPYDEMEPIVDASRSLVRRELDKLCTS